MKNISILITIISLGLTTFTGCGRQISSNVYTADTVGESAQSFPGVVLQVRDVLVQDKERLEEHGLGVGAGGLAGGFAGSAIGKGKGNILATVAGGILGAIGGAYAEKALKEQAGVEYLVQLDSGEVRSIVQGPDPKFGVGQLVYVIESKAKARGYKGRSRVVARS